MMTDRGASIVMVELVLSATLGAYPAAGQNQMFCGYHSSTYGVPLARKCPTLTHWVLPMVILVHQRLVHVAEQQVPRLRPAHRVEQGLAAALHPLGHGVEQQLGHLRRDVGAQHVDRADRLDLGGEHVVVELVRRPVDRAQPAAHEPERQPADLGPLAVEHLVAGPQVLGPQPGNVDVAVGQVGRASASPRTAPRTGRTRPR